MTANRRMMYLAAGIFLLDQGTKQAVLRYLDQSAEVDVINGFFRLVHWGNTGAAWSMFHNQNALLAIVSLLAFLALFLFRHHFDTRTVLGQTSLGLIFGGILGNLWDRLFVGHVVDFLRFYVISRGGEEKGFPAFNVADSAICVGVCLLFVLSWRMEAGAQRSSSPGPDAT